MAPANFSRSMSNRSNKQNNNNDGRENRESTIAGSNTNTISDDTIINIPSNGSLHHEHHKENSQFVSDAIIGFADGLTVPFALTAGLSA
jgi:hypothetical protein